MLWSYHKTKCDQKNFDKLALYVLHNRITPEDARRINNQVSKANFSRMALIRSLLIIRDSIEIALSSKRWKTAESRMALLMERHQEILDKQANLVSAPELEEINRTIQQAERDFHTDLYINLANGYIEKVNKLKTEKSKWKNITCAIETLNEGIDIGLGDINKLKNALRLVESERQSLADKQHKEEIK